MIKFKSKYLCMVICCVVFAISLCGIMVSTKPNAASAETDITRALNDFSLKDGASVRIGNSYTDSGLKYEFIMPKESYETVKTTYPDATFGILIAPNEWLDYTGPMNNLDYSLTAENVFGANAKYCYATWDSENNTWIAPAESNKKQIINFNTSVIAGEKDGNVFFFGSMTNVLEKNYTREFAAVPYISYTVDGKTQYVFKTRQNSNIRSITYVAMLAIENNDSNKTFLQEKYVDVVKDEETTYEITYYKQNGNSYEKTDAPSSLQTKVATKVTAMPKAYDGYVLNAEKSTLTGNAYPNNKLNLSIYYDKIVASETILLDKKGKTDLTLEGLLLSDAQKAVFNDLNTLEDGSIKWWLGGTELDSTDATDIEGVYEVKAEYCIDSNTRCVLYSNTVDFYNSADGLVWQKQNALSIDNLVVTNKNSKNLTYSVVTDDIPTGASANVYYKITNDGDDNTDGTEKDIGWFANVLGLHSKDYYLMWQTATSNKNQTITVTYEYQAFRVENRTQNSYYNNHVSTQINVPFTYGAGNAAQGLGWLTRSMTLDKIIENWSKLSKTNVGYHEAMIVNYDAYYYGSAQTMYVGNFRSSLASTGNVIDNTSTTTLKDLKDTETFDLTTLISEEDKTTLDDISSYTWYLNGEAVEGSTISSSSVEGVYEVSLGYEVYPYKSLVYKTSVDFYNSENGMVWQLANALSINDLIVSNLNNATGITYSLVYSEDIPSGATASVYYKIYNPAQTKGSIGWSASVKGLHSKSYYESWQQWAEENNKTITVSYDFYVFRTKGDGSVAGNQVFPPFTESGGAATAKTWDTRSMTLTQIIDNWSKITSNTTSHVNMITANDSYYYGQENTMYIGNFTTTVTDNTTAE